MTDEKNDDCLLVVVLLSANKCKWFNLIIEVLENILICTYICTCII